MPKRFLDYRKESRANWGTTKEDGDISTLNFEQIQIGCMLRMADSMELMCRDREELERKVKNYGELADERYQEIKSLKKAVASYKGKWNKLKNQIAEMEAKCI